MELRDYQNDCIAAIRRDWRTHDRTLAVLATGTGKTLVFLALLDQLRQSGELGRALIIAHRRELIHQPMQRAEEFFSELCWDMGVVMADQDDCGARIVVATVQSLNSAGRLERILAAGPITHVVIDECHHGTASSYMGIVDQLPGAKVLGVTATPIRTDGDGLRKIFQKCSYRMPIKTAIGWGAWVSFDALGISLPVSFAGLKQTEDGWEAEAAGDILAAGNVLDIMLDKWRQLAGDRQTILFTASVAQAKATAEHFAAHDVRAEWVSGETPRDERDRILVAFKAGQVQLVANCMVLTEGFDAPETSCIVMAAPTRSDLIYVQRLGRGLRTAPGKANCRVLDFVPTEARNVVMAGDVLGKPRKVKEAEEQARRSGILVAWTVNEDGQASTIDPDKLIVKILNLLRKSSLAWSVKDSYLTATLSQDATLCIVLPDPARIAKMELAYNEGRLYEGNADGLRSFISSTRLYLVQRPVYRWQAELFGQYNDIGAAKTAADGVAEEMLDPTLGKRSSGWRREEPTDKQVQFAQRLGLTLPMGCTKGQCAQLITERLTIQAVAVANDRLEKAAYYSEASMSSADPMAA